MEKPLLSDKDQFPTQEIIFSHIGRFAPLWILFFDYIHQEHPEFTEEWRYYNDGKSWLMKVQRKGKTVFWLSLTGNTFRTTFYFPVKAEQLILQSPLSDELKNIFNERNRTLKNHGFTVLFKNKKDIKQAEILCDLKLSIM